MSSISATTATACQCCGTPGTLECRTRGGTATLVGHDEFTSPSTPPKKYRDMSVSGYWATCDYSGFGCTGHVDANRMEYAGTCNYSATTGSATNTFNRKYGVNTDCNTPPTTSAYDNPLCERPYTPDTGSNGDYPSIATITTSGLTRKWDYENGTWAPCTQAGGVYRTWHGEVDWVLSTEDTEADAIARLVAGTSWGSWLTVGGGCSLPACCLANYEPRTAGFSFAYQEAQLRVTASGLTPSTNYDAVVPIYRRTYGSGSYAVYELLIVSGTTDGSGNFSVTTDVPNARGYDSYAGSPIVVLA